MIILDSLYETTLSSLLFMVRIQEYANQTPTHQLGRVK